MRQCCLLLDNAHLIRMWHCRKKALHTIHFDKIVCQSNLHLDCMNTCCSDSFDHQYSGRPQYSPLKYSEQLLYGKNWITWQIYLPISYRILHLELLQHNIHFHTHIQLHFDLSHTGPYFHNWYCCRWLPGTLHSGMTLCWHNLHLDCRCIHLNSDMLDHPHNGDL